MKYLLSLTVLLCAGWHVSVAQVDYGKYFSRCEVLRFADSSVIEINTGCCGVTFRDVNGDGMADMLIGEFGEVLCPGQGPEVKKPFVQGRCRAYVNYGTKERPVYKDFKWLESDGEPLYVPITCCVSMTPAYADMDGDGVDELFSGCYKGEIYRWKQGENGQYMAREVICLADGTPVKVGKAVTVFPVDANGDGKIDLLMTSLYDGIFIACNTGTEKEYRFEKVEPVLNTAGKKIDANHAVLYDWDGDGVLDLVYGSGYGGNVYWCKGLGNGTYANPELLVGRLDGVEAGIDPGQGHGDKPKICIYDYDGDGKDDLILATEMWKDTGCEMTSDLFHELLKDERYVKVNKKTGALEKKMRKYTDQVPQSEYDKPDSKIPGKLYNEWLIAWTEASAVVQRVLEELTVSDSHWFGTIWVYYRK